MNLENAAKLVAERLAVTKRRLVLAESCTAGLVAASLATVPGISDWFCGSTVTYRNRSKIDWLGVSKEAIEKFTAVSENVARQMASGVLAKTVEADLSAAITGHLGPNAPEGFDGLVFIGVGWRQDGEIVVDVHRHHLTAKGRQDRQREAAELVLKSVATGVR